MKLIINDECIACDACVPECPVQAISEGDPLYVLDQNVCTLCEGIFDEPQCMPVCPTDAVVEEESKGEGESE